MDNLKIGDCIKCVCSVGCNFRGIIFKIEDNTYYVKNKNIEGVQEILLKKLCQLITDVEEIHKMKLYFYGNL